MQIQMLFPLEAFHAHAADMWTLGAVAQLVPFQVLLTLQAGAANVADVPSLDLVHHQMLFEVALVRIRHLALRTTEQNRSVQSCGDVYLSRFLGAWFGRFLLVLSLLFHLSGTVRLRWSRCRLHRDVGHVGGRRRGVARFQRIVGRVGRCVERRVFDLSLPFDGVWIELEELLQIKRDALTLKVLGQFGLLGVHVGRLTVPDWLLFDGNRIQIPRNG